MRLMALIALAEMEAAAGDSDGAAATIDGVVAEAEHRQSPAFLARARTVLATMPA
jgi:ATP/maltotriose-dependent transcriptional regulator MalT